MQQRWISLLFIGFVQYSSVNSVPQLKVPLPDPAISRPSISMPAHVAGQLLVKFRDEEDDRPGLKECAHCVFERGAYFQDLTSDSSLSLDSLIEKHSIWKITPLFRQAEKTRGTQRTSSSSLKSNWQHRLNTARNHFSRRSNRAPKNYKMPELFHIYRVEFSPERDLQEVLVDFSRDPHVEYAQLNLLMELSQQSVPNKRLEANPFPIENSPFQPWPDDPFFHSSNSWGQMYDDLWGLKKIQAKEAWMQSTGEGEEVVVAVIDTGVDYLHPDIQQNIWQNTGERFFPNGIDEDGNGFVDDRIGWDFVSCAQFDAFGNCIEFPATHNNPIDEHGHGTHVAGTIAAVGNNGIGIIGVAPHAKIMALKGLNRQGAGSSQDLADAIVYAAMNGADVLNNSWGCGGSIPQLCIQNPILEEAVQTAYGLGAVVVFAAGNSHVDVGFISPQNQPETIAVASTDHLDEPSDFSNYGLKLDLAAPGGESTDDSCGDFQVRSILSLRANSTDLYGETPCVPPLSGQMIVGENYIRARGTSMASPHVAGAAAFLLSQRPEFGIEELRQALRVSADDIGAPGVDALSGHGRLNVSKAVTVPTPLRVRIFSPHSGFAVSTLDEEILIRGIAAGAEFLQYSLFFKSISAEQWQLLSFNSTQPVENGILASWPISELETDYYQLKLIAETTTGRIYEDQIQVFIERDLVTVSSDLAWEWHPAIWGDRIVWQDSRDGGVFNTRIYLYDLATHEERALTQFNSIEPRIWGENVVWRDKRSGYWRIYLYDLSKNQERQISHGPGEQSGPSIWENWIAWRDTRNGGNDVYLFNLLDGEERRVTAQSTLMGDPIVSEGRIVWSDSRHGNLEVHLYDIATETELRLTNNPLNNWACSLSGDRLVFSEDDPSGLDRYFLLNFVTGETRALFVNSPYVHNQVQIQGDRLIWQQGPSNNYSIRLLDLNNQQEYTVVSGTTPTDPTIWEDRIVWADFRQGNFNIYLKYYFPPEIHLEIESPFEGISLDPLLQNVVEIQGSASGENFLNYELHYGFGQNPSTWTALGGVMTTPIEQGLLGTWNIQSLPLGNYILRLRLTLQDGTQYQHRVPLLIEPIADRITFNLSDQLYPDIDGTKLVWEDARNSYKDIYLYDFVTQEERALVARPGDQISPAIFGSHVVYVDAATNPYTLWVYDLDSETESVVSQLSGEIFNPQIDGEHIVWGQRYPDSGLREIYVFDMSRGKQQLLYSSNTVLLTPRVSEHRVLWSDSGSLMLHDLEQGTTDLLPISSFPNSGLDIAGDKVVWVNTAKRVVLYDLNTGIETLMPVNYIIPAAKDSVISDRYVVWEENYNLYFYDLNSAQVETLTVNPRSQSEIAISGSQIVWQDNRNLGLGGTYTWDIYSYSIPNGP